MTEDFDSCPNRTPEEAAANYLRLGDPGDTVICFTCGHTPWAHYRTDVGEGCIAITAPSPTLDQLIADQPAHPEVAGAAGCLCPGFVQGRYPWAIRKHLDGIGEGDCVSCRHDLEEHTAEYGCLDCPCEVGLGEAV